jgi:hypothetical protein
LNINNNNNNNSILYYLCAESTATRPITDTAQHKYNNNTIIIIIVMGKFKTPLQFLQYNLKVYVDHIGSRCPLAQGQLLNHKRQRRNITNITASTANKLVS